MKPSDDMRWTKDASCSGTDTESFFVDDGDKRYDNEPLLKRICNACPVQSECLDYSLHNAVVGWWGGTSERNRRALRRKLGIIAKSIASEGYGIYE